MCVLKRPGEESRSLAMPVTATLEARSVPSFPVGGAERSGWLLRSWSGSRIDIPLPDLRPWLFCPHLDVQLNGAQMYQGGSGKAEA